jgi:integrase/recombinase XerD
MHNTAFRICSDASDTHMQTAQQHSILSLHTSSGARKYLDAAERSRFISAAMAAPVALRLLCLTLALTGCRVSEALALTPDSLRPAEGVIAFRSLKKRSKTVVVREVPVPDEVLSELVVLASHCTTTEDRLWRWGRVRAWQLVKVIMSSAGIRAGPHATVKGLRHAFGLHAVRSGVPLNFVQRWLGHASMSTTAIYLQAVGPDEREIAARMWTAY